MPILSSQRRSIFKPQNSTPPPLLDPNPCVLYLDLGEGSPVHLDAPPPPQPVGYPPPPPSLPRRTGRVQPTAPAPPLLLRPLPERPLCTRREDGEVPAPARGGGHAPWRRRLRVCRCGGELARRAEPGVVPQGIRVRDGDVGVLGRGHGGRRRPRALHLGRVSTHPRFMRFKNWKEHCQTCALLCKADKSYMGEQRREPAAGSLCRRHQVCHFHGYDIHTEEHVHGTVIWSDTVKFRTPPAAGSDEVSSVIYRDMGKAPLDPSVEHYIQPGLNFVTSAVAKEMQTRKVDLTNRVTIISSL